MLSMCFWCVDPIFPAQYLQINEWPNTVRPEICSQPRAHIVTRFCCFFFGLCVCVWLRQTDLPRGVEFPSTQCLWRHKDSLTLLWTFRGAAEATGEAKGRHSCSPQTMHCFAHSTERRQAAHMSQNVITQNRLSWYFFFSPFEYSWISHSVFAFLKKKLIYSLFSNWDTYYTV